MGSASKNGVKVRPSAFPSSNLPLAMSDHSLRNSAHLGLLTGGLDTLFGRINGCHGKIHMKTNQQEGNIQDTPSASLNRLTRVFATKSAHAV